MLNITLNEARKSEKRVLKYLTSREGDKKKDIFKTLPKKLPITTWSMILSSVRCWDTANKLAVRKMMNKINTNLTIHGGLQWIQTNGDLYDGLIGYHKGVLARMPRAEESALFCSSTSWVPTVQVEERKKMHTKWQAVKSLQRAH